MNALQICYAVALVPPVICVIAAYLLRWDWLIAFTRVIVVLGIRLFVIVFVLHLWLTAVSTMLQR